MGVAVVTGSNRGIGLALVSELQKRGFNVIAACRQSSPELEALGVTVVEGVDVGQEEGVERLVAAIGESLVDLLVNNAGIAVWGDRFEAPLFDDMVRQFEVNAVGPIRVTHALAKRLHRGSKVAVISSRMGSVGDNESGGAYGYRMSKAALNMAAVSMARDLAERGVMVAVLHPGMVSTDMVGGDGEIEPNEAAIGLLNRIDQMTHQTSGTFWHQNGKVLPW